GDAVTRVGDAIEVERPGAPLDREVGGCLLKSDAIDGVESARADPAPGNANTDCLLRWERSIACQTPDLGRAPDCNRDVHRVSASVRADYHSRHQARVRLRLER